MLKNLKTPDMISDNEILSSELNAGGQTGVKLHVFAQLESTSVWLRERADELLQDAKTGSPLERRKDAAQLCAVDWQCAGIARRGRNWQTRPGNITFSILTQTHRQAKDLMGLSLVTGVAIASCLREEYGLNMRLKWPNDVLINNAKVGGILTEILSDNVAGQTDQRQLLLTGIGINVLHDNEVLKLGIGGTSLAACGVELKSQQRDALIGKLAASVLSAHQLFFQAGWLPFTEKWMSYDWLLDREVSIDSDSSTEHAVARGVNEHGALLIERAGQLIPLYSGNISIRPIE